MSKLQNVFYINIISGYLEKFIVGKMPAIAYFSKEIMLMKEKKLYNKEKLELAQDYIDIAEHYSLPVTFIGIMWSRFEEKFSNYSEEVQESLVDTGVMVESNINNEVVKSKVWRITRGSTDIFLLDCNIEENTEEFRRITTEESEGDSSNRILTDILISDGGIKVVESFNLKIDKFHFNGEYLMFWMFKMLKKLKSKNGNSVEAEFARLRNKCVATIHDVHMKNYRLQEIIDYLNVQEEDRDIMKMVFHSNNIYTNIALNTCACNSISILQGDSIRKKIENTKVKENIIDIVNGIYLQNHLEYEILKAFKAQKNVLDVHTKLKENLLRYIYSKTFVEFKKDKLTLGLIATSNEYERWNLILRDKEKLYELLEEDKVQLIFYIQPSKSSKAEINFKKYLFLKKKYPNNIIFMNNLDEKLEKSILNGCDVLLNTSKIPQDSCGLTRIKASINGVLNFSTLNGCWPEACVEGINGWQIGSGVRIKNSKEQDIHDIESLFDILRNKIISIYYEDKEKWEDIVMQSIKSTLEYFCIERIIIEYTENLYRK